MKKQSFININKFQKVLSILLILLFLNPIYAKVVAQPTVLQEGKNIIKSNYVNTVSDYVLNAPDLTEMVKRLNDPYSDYFTKKEYSEFTGSINNTFSGIGIGIDLVPEGIRVSRVIENSPAIDAGLVAGDIIVQADNSSLVGITSTEEAIKYIKGESGTYVKIVVHRGTEVLNFNIQRREIKSPTVECKMLTGKVAYITIVSFGEDTGDLFSKALTKMNDLGAKSYIIDLRYNGGGYMGTALDIAGHFIGNEPAIIIEDKNSVQYKYKAVAHDKLIDKPIIFLINQYSASASEILAAAVKDYDKALFVGTTTYGKGVAQQMFPLSDGSYLKLTVEKFFSPQGNIIHKIGISPDFKAADDVVDSLKVANLLLSGASVPKDKSGYMRIDLDGKEFYIDLKMARSEEYWTTFTYILSKSSLNNSYSGTNVGWEKITSDELSSNIFQGFSNYKILSDLKKDLDVDKHFTINFNMNIDQDSIKAQGIELMEASTGKRISLKLEANKNTVIATPIEQLEKGQTYYLIVNDSVSDINGKKIKQGTVIKYIMP
ncbi:Ig-like domain-containing protein [Clostridium bowmanii]|uniref:S41 family peptidase n=1 Tax=Clostridium bowmanii TaxID=132925 RepID=UPI001C0D0D10|nr:S41 family peptidase [Clostridium bowmanii]MBU3189897.1 PDZ domain-containing protein [Clostridium bowmanii]MCA1074381.1 Ig-like domain-containing protein [Clostridium bowmanii]